MSSSPNPNTSPRLDSEPKLPDSRIKLVVVGDGGVGKTCLLIRYAKGDFPTEYVPTVFENYVLNIPYPRDPVKIVEFALWDTAGQEEYDRLRPLSYPETHILLICFSVDVPASLENVEDKWYPEVSHFCDGIPLILVATKTDLRQDARAKELLAAQGRQPISTVEGQAVAKRIGARYMEVCALKDRGVKEVFEEALEEALGKGRKKGQVGGAKKKTKCVIL